MWPVLEGGYIPERIAEGRPGPHPSPRLTSSSRNQPLAIMRLESEILTLTTKHPFIIARCGSSDYRTVWVRLIDDDGVEDWGEAAPNKFYGETADTVLGGARNVPDRAARQPVRSRRGRADLAASSWAIMVSARAALSAALHDLAAKASRCPAVPDVGTPTPLKPPCSTYTIGIDTSPRSIRQKVAEAEQYPDTQGQARAVNGDRRNPRDHPWRHRQGNPGRRQLRLEQSSKR